MCLGMLNLKKKWVCLIFLIFFGGKVDAGYKPTYLEKKMNELIKNIQHQHECLHLIIL